LKINIYRNYKTHEYGNVALKLKEAAISSPSRRVVASNETISHFSGQDNNELHLSSLQSLAYPKGRPNDIAIHPVPGGYFESDTPAPATVDELPFLSWHM